MFNNAPLPPAVASGNSLDEKELSSEDIASRVLSRIKFDSAILFHDGVQNTPDALEVILKKLKDDGYKVVTVSELIYDDNYTIDHTGKQIKK